jgi:hypothetical protein
MNRFRIASSALLAFTFVFGASLVHGQLTPSADAYTNTASPATNYGTAATLNVESASQTAYIRFDLSAIPAGYTGANIAQASLKLYVNAVSTMGSFNVNYVDGAWSESTITSNLLPAMGTTIASNVSLPKSNAHDYIVINITSALAAWLDGTQANDGIALVANSPLSCSFDSKENTGTSHAPELDIVFLGNGAQGPAGPQGSKGPQGTQGVSGPIGLSGPQGVAGPAGINNRGTWVSTTAYNINDSVAYAGSSWIALIVNTDSAPSASNSNWQLLAAKGMNNQGSWVSSVNYQVDDAVTDGGQFWIAVAPNLDSEPSILNPNWQLVSASGAAGPAGPVGPQGVAGQAGSTGPAGPTGAQGAQGGAGPQGPIGPMGLAGMQGAAGAQGPPAIFSGTWSNASTYSLGSAVFYNGSSYVSLTNTNVGNEPDTNPTQWALLAQQGAAGATGPVGPAGPQGAVGPQGPVGTTGAAGPIGSQGLTGATGLVGAQGPMGPQGPMGSAGAQGPQGPAGSVGTIAGGMNAALLRWYPQTFSVGTSPEEVAFDGTNIWVTNFGASPGAGSVTELSASTGAVVGTYPIGNNPQSVAFDGTNIWVTNNVSSGTVTELLASTGAVVGTFSVGSFPRGVAFDGANIWVANSGNGSGNTVTKVLASSGAVVGTFSVGNNPQSVAFDGANIWVANSNGNTVTKLLASSGAVVGTFSVGQNPVAVAFDGSNMWVTNNGGTSVTKLLASTGALVGTFSVGAALTGATGLAFDGTNIWVANSEGGTLTRLLASTGAVAATYIVGNFPEGVAFDGANVWVANSGNGTGNTVTKIPVN